MRLTALQQKTTSADRQARAGEEVEPFGQGGVKPIRHAVIDGPEQRPGRVAPDSRRQQCRRREHLPGDLDVRVHALDVIPEPQPDNHHRPQHDRGRYTNVTPGAGGRIIIAAGQLAQRQPCDPTEKHGDATEVGDFHAMDFSRLVRPIDDLVVRGHHAHDRREHERDDERRVKNIHVRCKRLVHGEVRRSRGEPGCDNSVKHSSNFARRSK
jgi:hypothetical protein